MPLQVVEKNSKSNVAQQQAQLPQQQETQLQQQTPTTNTTPTTTTTTTSGAVYQLPFQPGRPFVPQIPREQLLSQQHQQRAMPQDSTHSTLVAPPQQWPGGFSSVSPTATYPYDSSSDYCKKAPNTMNNNTARKVELPPPPPVLSDQGNSNMRKRKIDSYGDVLPGGSAPASFMPDLYQTDFVHRRRTSSNNSIPEFIHRSRTVSNNSLGPLDFLPRDRSLSNNSLILPTPFTTGTSNTKRMEDGNLDLYRYFAETDPMTQDYARSIYYLQQQSQSNHPRQSPLLPPHRLQLPQNDPAELSNQQRQSRGQPHYEPSPHHQAMMQMHQQQQMYINYANQQQQQQQSRHNFDAGFHQSQANAPAQKMHGQTSLQSQENPSNVTDDRSSNNTAKASTPKSKKKGGTTTGQSKRRKTVKSPSAITSHYRGVCWYKRTGRWVVQIKVNGMRRHVGYFACEHEAAKAYDKALAEMIEQVKNKPRTGTSRNRVFNPEKRKPNLDVAHLEALQKQLSEDRKSAKPSGEQDTSSSSKLTNDSSANVK